MNNRLSWNLILPWFIHNISSYVSGSSPFMYNLRVPKYKQNNMRHQISRQKINQDLKLQILISNFDFLLSRLPDIVQKYFFTPDIATDPTSKWNFSHVCIRRYYSNNIGDIFLWDTLYIGKDHSMTFKTRIQLKLELNELSPSLSHSLIQGVGVKEK